MRIGYADPPYPGQAAKHYAEHPDFAAWATFGRQLDLPFPVEEATEAML